MILHMVSWSSVNVLCMLAICFNWLFLNLYIIFMVMLWPSFLTSDWPWRQVSTVIDRNSCYKVNRHCLLHLIPTLFASSQPNIVWFSWSQHCLLHLIPTLFTSSDPNIVCFITTQHCFDLADPSIIYFSWSQHCLLHLIPTLYASAPCKERPRDLGKGMVRFYTMNHGDKAKYICETGFKLQGSDYKTCQYGKWVSPKEEPYCEQSKWVAIVVW